MLDKPIPTFTVANTMIHRVTITEDINERIVIITLLNVRWIRLLDYYIVERFLVILAHSIK